MIEAAAPEAEVSVAAVAEIEGSGGAEATFIWPDGSYSTEAEDGLYMIIRSMIIYLEY